MDLTEADLTQARKVFRMFDKDNSGSISLKELGKCLRGLGQNPTTDELKQMIVELDQNKNGLIEFEEFLVMYKEHFKSKEDLKAEIKAAFDVFDKDRSGFLSFKELRAALKFLGEELSETEIRSMFRDADRDGDKRISLAEFTTVLTS